MSQFSRRYALAFTLAALAIAVRVPGVGRPLVGNFATKNVVYAMVARNVAADPSSWLTPTLDCLAHGRPAWHLVELPVTVYMTAFMWSVCGGSLDVWGRATSIAETAAAVVLLYLLLRRRHGEVTAAAGAMTLALAPVSVIYGQSFMLEPSVVLLWLVVMWSADRRAEGAGARWLVVLAAALGLLVLTKIFAAVAALPAAAALLGARPRADRKRWAVDFTVACLTMLLLGGAWYAYAWWLAGETTANAGRLFYSLRDSVAAHEGTHRLLVSGEFYRRLLADALTVGLTPLGFALALVGLLRRQCRRYGWWLGSSLLLIALLPRKFHEMNYYLLVVLPPFCALAGLGFAWLWTRVPRRVVWVPALVALALATSFRWSVKPAFSIPLEDRAVTAAGQAAARWTRPDQRVITMHGSTIDLLYYTGRRGWNVAPGPRLDFRLAELISQGAVVLAVAGCEPLPDLAAESAIVGGSPLLERGKGFAVYGLAGTGSAAVASRR